MSDRKNGLGIVFGREEDRVDRREAGNHQDPTTCLGGGGGWAWLNRTV